MLILNNRELSVLIWSGLAILWGLSKKRELFSNILASLCESKLLIFYLLILSYAICVTYGLKSLGLWDISSLKMTIVWFTFTGFLLAFKSISVEANKGFFRKVFLSNLKLLVVIEFVMGLYPFSFWVEFFLFPVTFFISLMYFYSQTQERYKGLENILAIVLTGLVLLMLGHSIMEVSEKWTDVLSLKTMNNFFMPLLLMTAFTPLIFFLSIYSVYERVYGVIDSNIDDVLLARFAKYKVLKRFRFNTALLDRWKYNISGAVIKSRKDIEKTFNDLDKILSVEGNRQSIPIVDGWAPFEAKKFLIDEGLEVGYYKPVTGGDQEWWACSQYYELGDQLLSNNIAYYLDGTATAVKELRLKLNVNLEKDRKADRESLLILAIVLIRKALQMDVPREVASAISEEKNCEFIVEGKIISVETLKFSGSGGGYSICLEISSEVEDDNALN